MWIKCEQILGHGTITARGGRGGFNGKVSGGGGGGGRISIQTFDIAKFNVTILAPGGMYKCLFDNFGG